MSAAGDGLHALSELIRPPVSLYAHSAVTRLVIENAAMAYWLLDPGIQLRSRMVRALSEVTASTKQFKGAVVLLTDEHKQEVREILKECERLRKDLGVALVDLPGFTSLVGSMLDMYTTRKRSGEGIYRYLAALSHGTPYALLQRHRAVQDAPLRDGRHLLEPFLPTSALELSVGFGIRAHALAAHRSLAYFGGDGVAWSTWLDEFPRLWAGDDADAPNSLSLVPDSVR